jgi:MFS transporter, NNP family, nitrate/nitrite transporter
MFGALLDLTGVRSTAFMLMYGVVWVSLIWMYWTEVRRTDFMHHAMLDKQGKVQAQY